MNIKCSYKYVGHTGYGAIYNVVGIVRSAKDPHVKVVVSEALHKSELSGTNIRSLIGSLWMRDIDDFTNKIIRVSTFDNIKSIHTHHKSNNSE